MLFLSTDRLIERPDGDEMINVEVVVYFSSHLTASGYPATREEPGCGNEWEHTIEKIVSTEYSAKHKRHVDIDDLTEEEKAKARAWFELPEQQNRADEYADEEYASEDGYDG